MILLTLGLIGIAWWAWSLWYNHTHKPIPIVASPLGMREGNYAQAVPAGRYRR